MWILPLVGYIGLILGFAFLTLSIASGLYYLSDLVEEHTVFSAKLLKRLIYAVILAQVLLWAVDGFPWHLTLLGIASHGIYRCNLRHFPVVKLSDPFFISSCVLVVLNHWLWFRHFSQPIVPYKTRSAASAGGQYGRDRYSNNLYAQQPTFTEIASYFGLCVWLIPFALFVSLSAGENVLPTMGSEYATGDRAIGGGIGGGSSQGGSGDSGTFKKGHRRRNTGMAKAAVNNATQWVSETGAIMGLWKADNVKDFRSV